MSANISEKVCVGIPGPCLLVSGIYKRTAPMLVMNIEHQLKTRIEVKWVNKLVKSRTVKQVSLKQGYIPDHNHIYIATAVGASESQDTTMTILRQINESRCVNVLLTNPIWVVVTRMQTHTKKSPTDPIVSGVEPPPFATSNAVQEIFGEAGILGFWKGVFPTLVMVSNPSIQFMLYETLLKKLKQRHALSNSNKGVTALEIFLLGAVAKLGATVVTYPLLVVKAIANKIKRCKTDSFPGLEFDNDDRPECNNLLSIYQIITNRTKELYKCNRSFSGLR
ncbi:substrate carrier protein [Artemisia annua]|uniref:Substrate carrier protein n=1 Tax=Artemisia annua TaxID=35608 RepID=A0A2U1Q1Y5_ARTAN|nr:substrate carrier protein [Artemisia annua]